MPVDKVLAQLKSLTEDQADFRTALIGHALLVAVHTKAIACHCECLGMNAENMWAACTNTTPPFTRAHYDQVMQKWELTNEKGEPII